MEGKADLGDITLSSKIVELRDYLINTGYQKFSSRAPIYADQVSPQRLLDQPGIPLMIRLNNLSLYNTRSDRFEGSIKNQPMINGNTTLTNSIAKPLIIVDNFIYTGDINSINPNDIENVSILKDAAATSIWGSRSANGVIVITMKKGKYNQRIRITINNSFTFFVKPDLFKYPAISSPDLVSIQEYQFDKGDGLSDTLTDGYPALPPVYEILLQRKRGQISEMEASLQLQRLADHDVRNDYNRYFYQSAFSRESYINVNGGNMKHSWNLSVGYDNGETELKATSNKAVIYFTNDWKLGNVAIHTAVAWTRARAISGAPAYNNDIATYTWLADEAGNPVPVETNYRAGYTDTAGSPVNWKFYLLNDYQHSRKKTNTTNLNLQAGIDFRILPYLKTEMNISYLAESSFSNTLYDDQSFYTRNLINSFYQPNGPNKYPVPLGVILDWAESLSRSINLRGQLNYSRSWSNNFQLTSKLGIDVMDTRTNNQTGMYYGYDPSLLSITPVDHANMYLLYSGAGSKIIPTGDGLNGTDIRFLSLFITQYAEYKKKYFLVITHLRPGGCRPSRSGESARRRTSCSRPRRSFRTVRMHSASPTAGSHATR